MGQKIRYNKTQDATENINPKSCPFKIDSEPLYKAAEKHNKLGSDNVFTWRMCFNAYLWIKYVGSAAGFLIFYVILGYVVGKVFGIALPLLAPLFDVVLISVLFSVLGGWAILILLWVMVYITWRNSKNSYFQKHQTNFIGRYQGYSVVRGPLGMGSRNIIGKTTPWVVQVEYLDEKGEKYIAQSYLGNIPLLAQLKPGDELTICRIKGHFRKSLDIALIPYFIGDWDKEWAKEVERQREIISAQEAAEEYLDKQAEDFRQQAPATFPLNEYVPEHVNIDSSEYELTRVNRMSEARIRKLAILSGHHYALRRALGIGLLSLAALMSDFVDYVGQKLTFMSYTTATRLALGLFIVMAVIAFFYSYYEGFMTLFYWVFPPKKKPKYKIKRGTFVSYKENTGKYVGNYAWVVVYRDEKGNSKTAALHIDNLIAIGNAKEGLPLTIVQVPCLWPYKREFAYVESFFSMVDEPFDISGSKLYNC